MMIPHLKALKICQNVVLFRALERENYQAPSLNQVAHCSISDESLAKTDLNNLLLLFFDTCLKTVRNKQFCARCDD